ncbi:MAG: hypothetical protein KME07_12640 [Pegethrix bostrychoides GSE-TBD4-15B]|uniref:Uncharacterized protein n=1 Tax=Pegethrix bostrychoides GSE-TBD4-15B TaxID=2839662 RepID=A0A951PAX4_9CYAN|nr:hypothetical protein [Pegethrix bostrychoides GSE-TBD4-15B]
MPLSIILPGIQPVQSQVIYRSTTVQPNRDYYYPHTGQSGYYNPGSGSGTTIRDSRIRDSTLVNPVVIDSEIENSTVINPVIVAPRSTRVVQQRSYPAQHYPGRRVGESVGSGCMLFREIRQACQ